MATNPIPKGTRNLTINVPEEFHSTLKEKAADSRMSLSKYVHQVLRMTEERRASFHADQMEVGENLLVASNE